MEKEVKQLIKYMNGLKEFVLPKYKELPSVDLYMEQVLKYVNDNLQALSVENQNLLTSFMVNNYVKAKMIALPNKKKYGKEQIGYLMAICMLKSSLSMSDMSLMIEFSDQYAQEKSKIYDFWADLEMEILHKIIASTKNEIDSSLSKYEKSQEEYKETNLKYELALLALKLSIEAEANKLMADFIIDALRKDMHESTYNLETQVSNSELKHEYRSGEHAASRLANAKESQKRAIREEKKTKEISAKKKEKQKEKENKAKNNGKKNKKKVRKDRK